MPFLGGGTLIPGKKNGDGVRPLEVGEVFRRWFAKVLAVRPSTKASIRKLVPLQNGASVPGACELTGMGMAEMQRHLLLSTDPRTMGILQVDLTNAFNSLHRQHMLNCIHQRAPSLLPWALSCYAQYSHLFCREHLLSSASGAQQGDPLGPLFFALGWHDVAEKVQSACSLTGSPFISMMAILFGHLMSLSVPWRI